MKNNLSKDNIAEAIFETLSLYVIDQKFHDKVKEITPKNLKPIQDEVEKLIGDLGLEIDE